MSTKRLHGATLASTAFLLLFSASGAIGAPNMVTEVSLTPDSPNILANGQQVTVRFKYRTTDTGGVRIFARPYTDNNLTPNYGACGSPLYAFPSGSGSCTFTISTGSVNVDNIRFQMYNANQTTRLFEAFIPVHYRYR